MDLSRVTQSHVSYVFSKNVILKGLLEQGTISRADFDRYDQMLYDRYHIDSSLQIPRPIVPDIATDVEGAFQENSEHRVSYVSLTSIAKK